jgi:hypothetical protein
MHFKDKQISKICHYFAENKKQYEKFFQPELHYWTCESFNGHFFGLHALAR